MTNSSNQLAQSERRIASKFDIYVKDDDENIREHRNLILHHLQNAKTGGPLQNGYPDRVEFVVVLNEGPDAGKQVGWSVVYCIQKDHESMLAEESGIALRVKTGVMIDEGYRRRGLASECMRLVKKFCFEELHDLNANTRFCVNALTATVHGKNIPMLELMKGAGKASASSTTGMGLKDREDEVCFVGTGRDFRG